MFSVRYYSVRTPKLDCQLKYTSKAPEGQTVGRGSDEHSVIMVSMISLPSLNYSSVCECIRAGYH